MFCAKHVRVHCVFLSEKENMVDHVPFVGAHNEWAGVNINKLQDFGQKYPGK